MATPNPIPTTPKDPLKPGVQTSEGIITMLVTFIQALVYLLSVFGVLNLSPEQKQAVAQIIPITLTLTAGMYSLARARIKASAAGSEQPAANVTVGEQNVGK